MVRPLFCSSIMSSPLELESILNKFISNPDHFGILFDDLMKNEWTRLRSFYIRRTARWPVSFISPEDLANAGFFYLNSDRVQCAFCRGIVTGWERGDRPLTEHSRHFPRCPFIMEENVGNIPINTDPIHGIPRHHRPVHPTFQSREARRQTFTNFPTVVSYDSLADAGFFAIGISDYVKCYHCDLGLGTWVPGDNPWVEHAKYNPDCNYVYITKGRSFIDSCIQALANEIRSISSDPLVQQSINSQPSSTQPLTDAQQLTDAIAPTTSQPSQPSESPELTELIPASIFESDMIKCKICFDENIGIVFLPCGHQMACTQCASCIDICPICRKPIRQCIRTFFA